MLFNKTIQYTNFQYNYIIQVYDKTNKKLQKQISKLLIVTEMSA